MTRRFERIERKYKHFTQRDGQIVESVYSARYMTNLMIQRLLFSPTTFSWCKTRIRLLFDKGFLKKRDTFQNERDVYFLGLQGRHYISKKFQLEQTYVDKVAGIQGTGKLPTMFLEHDLTVASIYVATRLVSTGLAFTWKNDRMLEMEKLPVNPDGHIELSSGQRSKEAYVEFTSVLPDSKEMERKLDGYKELLKDQAVLWFTTSRAKCNKIREYVSKSRVSRNVLVGLIEDVNGIIGKPIFWNALSDKQVTWIRVGVGSSTPALTKSGVDSSNPLRVLEAPIDRLVVLPSKPPVVVRTSLEAVDLLPLESPISLPRSFEVDSLSSPPQSSGFLKCEADSHDNEVNSSKFE